MYHYFFCITARFFLWLLNLRISMTKVLQFAAILLVLLLQMTCQNLHFFRFWDYLLQPYLHTYLMVSQLIIPFLPKVNSFRRKNNSHFLLCDTSAYLLVVSLSHVPKRYVGSWSYRNMFKITGLWTKKCPKLQ